MNDNERLIRAARRAGKAGNSAEVAAIARAWAAAQARANAWWADSDTLGWVAFTAPELALLMLSGRGAAVGRAVAGRVIVVGAKPDGSDLVRRLPAVPLGEIDNYSLRSLAWTRLVGADWRPLPLPRRGRGELPRRAADKIALAIVNAFASRDAARIRSVIRAARAFESRRSFSLLGHALTLEARRIGIAI